MQLKGSYYTTNELLYLFLSLTYNNKRPPMTLADNSKIYKISTNSFDITYCTEEQLNLHTSLNLPFTGKRISEIVLEQMNIPMDRLASGYNAQTYEIIESVSASPLRYNYETKSVEELNKLKASNSLVNVDIKRCYPTICANYKMPYLTSNQVFKPYDGVPKPNYWYVVEPQEYNIALGNCTFIPYDLLEYTTNIKIVQQIKPNYTNILQAKYKKLLVDPKYKTLSNMFIGLLSRTNKKKSNVIYTYSLAEIGYYAFLTGSKVNYLDFNGKRLYKTVPMPETDVNQFKYRMAYLQITMMSRVLCMKMLREIQANLKGFIPLHINTDGILGMQKKKMSLKFIDAASWYCKKTVNEFIVGLKKTEHNTQIITLDNIDLDCPLEISFESNYNEIKKIPKIKYRVISHRWTPTELITDETLSNSYRILGDPGTGKTLFLTELQDRLPKETTVTTTFTRLASTLIPNAKSCHEIFNVRTINNFNVSDNIIRYYKDHVTHLLVDECSMISRPIYEVFSLLKSINPNLKIYLFGDDNQFLPINSEPITHRDSLMRFLTGGNEIILNYQFRSNKDYIINLKKGIYKDIKQVKYDFSTKFNIALTNKTSDYINKKCMELYGDLNKSGCYIRFNKTTSFNGEKIPKNLLAEVDIVGQKVYLTQIFNGRLELSLEYKMSLDQYNMFIDRGNIKPGYCVSAFKSQGITIKEPYTIYDWSHFHMGKRAKYVACSRTSDPSLCFYSYFTMFGETKEDENKFYGVIRRSGYKPSVSKDEPDEPDEPDAYDFVEDEYELDINNNIWDLI